MKLNPKSPLAEAIREFESKLSNDTVDLPPEASGVVNEYFLDLALSEASERLIKETMDHSQKARTVSVGSY